MSNIEQYGPRGQVKAETFDVMVVDTVKCQRERFQEYQNGHHVMDFEYGMFGLFQQKHPEHAGKEKKDGEHTKQGRKWYVSSWQVTVTVTFGYLDIKVHHCLSVGVVVGATVEEQIVQSFFP